ncbi:hypothetical protein [Halarchaeum nitratireducens]|uniref:Uncharacterized protein n=1 Tax=Halarchaeum nitratireducens TaxID=489913 RepID=A0A830GBC7_9EURY|nr:hypothetical protein [Halarchaeum nitratireducens]GGN15423.1 hypothetical protein GCM10009021_14730 [Halarchaeum nitratireducens]
MRRHVIVLAALLPLVLLAGCSAAGSISMDPVSNAELVDHASRDAPTDEAEPDPEARMIRDAIRNGSATIEDRHEPVEAGLPFAYRGSYYDLSWTIVGEREATGVDIEVDYNASNVSANRIAYDDLPESDQRALDMLFPPGDNRRTEGYDLGTDGTYTDAEANRSVLVPTQEYDAVVYEGDAYPIRVSNTHDVTFNTYRYTSTVVADDADAYARQLKDEHLFTLDGLNESERAVVSEAINGSYYAEDTDDTAFRGVLERFRAHDDDAVQREETRGSWIVRYDDTVYWADLSYVQFDDEH